MKEELSGGGLPPYLLPEGVTDLKVVVLYCFRSLFYYSSPNVFTHFFHFSNFDFNVVILV